VATTSSIGTLDAIPILKPGEFDKIAQLAYDRFRVDRRNGKQGLVAARLGKKLRELGLKTFQEYDRPPAPARSGSC
jgi:chemotaxis protein methyltransferase CheR